MAWAEARAGGRDETDQATGNGWQGFRRELYRCFTAPGRNALSELCERGRCASRTGCICWRNCRWSQGISAGHGALYDALNCGKVQVLATALGTGRGAAAGLGMMAGSGWRVDVSNWLRPGRGDQPGPVVLPLLRAGEQQRADDPGLGRTRW